MIEKEEIKTENTLHLYTSLFFKASLRDTKPLFSHPPTPSISSFTELHSTYTCAQYSYQVKEMGIMCNKGVNWSWMLRCGKCPLCYHFTIVFIHIHSLYILNKTNNVSHLLIFICSNKQSQPNSSLYIAIKCSLYVVHSHKGKAHSSHNEKQAHTQADHIWSSPLKERNGENSLTHKRSRPPHHHQIHTHAMPCVSCPPSTPLLP